MKKAIFIFSLTACMMLSGCAKADSVNSSEKAAESSAAAESAVTSSPAEDAPNETPADYDGVMAYYDHVKENYDSSMWQEKMALPQESLKALSTSDLVEVMIRHPYVNIGLYDTFDGWADYVKASLDVTQELISREDAAEVLLDKYENAEFYGEGELELDLDALEEKLTAGEEPTQEEIDKLYEANKLEHYENIICMKDILSGMTDEQKHRFAETAFEKYTEKKEKGYQGFNHPALPPVLSFEDENNYSADYIYQKVAEYCG